jgi:hypothetical protein
MFIKQKVAIHGGSHYECLVVVPPCYYVDFVVHGSIFIVNKQQHYFCIKSHTPISCVSFLVNFLIDIFYYECYATCLL